MMVAEERAAPLRAERPNQHQTPESTTTCAFCGADRDVYAMGDDMWICTSHIGQVISMAANDLFSGDVSYSKAFEDLLMC